jgi:hypothetical protein
MAQKEAGTGWQHVDDGSPEHVEQVRQRLRGAMAEVSRTLIEMKKIAVAQTRTDRRVVVDEEPALIVAQIAFAETVDDLMEARERACAWLLR